MTMHGPFQRILASSLVAVLVACPSSVSLACTTIIVGKRASANGTILIARNSDSSHAVNAKHLIVHSSRMNIPGSVFHSNSNDFTYPYPERSPRYLGLPYWYAKNESFEQVGANEYGVAFSGTETIVNSDAVLRVDPYVKKTGINEDSLTSVVMQHARTAREGVELLGKIVSSQGAAEGFGVAVGDEKEVWYLETASGHHWAAVRIPDDVYFVSSNQGRLQEIDPGQPENFLASAGLIDFAIANKLYVPGTDGKFNFRHAFMRIQPADVAYNYRRIYRAMTTFTPSFKTDYTKGEFPTFMKPAKPLTKNDIAAMMRDHYQGTDIDPYTLANPSSPYRPIAVLRQSNSHITEIKANAAPGADIVTYFSFGMNLLSTYIPFYSGIENTPASFAAGDKNASDDSAFWTFRKVQVLAMENFKEYAPIVQKEYSDFEARVAERQISLEKEYNALYATDPIAATKMLQQFTDATAEEALAIARRLSNKLFTLETQAIDKKYHFEGE
jgi:dipeptidase